MTDNTQQNTVQSYSQWRSKLSGIIGELKTFLLNNKLTDIRAQQQFDTLLSTLADDSLTIAFVAEFSRGKTEIINSLFFSNFKQRVLPSSSGRTTMCPTELMYDPKMPCSIQLLPIESRMDDEPLYQLKKKSSNWQTIEFNAKDIDSIKSALAGMNDVKLVSKNYAQKLKFNLANESSSFGLTVNRYDEVEIPCWRHAIINIPHPMLEKGLVVIDTPGVNAIGAEPELTISLLGSAHSLVLVLSQASGVTASDLELWQTYLGGHPSKSLVNQQRKLVAINKIDSLWDGIRTDEEILTELNNQVWQTSKTLDLEPNDIYPISAQKGFLGRISKDEELIERSGLNKLEDAIFDDLIPKKKQLVASSVSSALEQILQSTNSSINIRRTNLIQQIGELRQLNDKNKDVITHLVEKMQIQKSALETDMRHYQSMRTVYNKEANTLFKQLSSERVEKLITITRHNMARCASSRTLKKTMPIFFSHLRSFIEEASKQASQLSQVYTNIIDNFEQTHGINTVKIKALSFDTFKHDIDNLEQQYSHLQSNRTLFFREQMTITERFYQSACNESKELFKRVLQAAHTWNNNLMTPLESQVREHHEQLRMRLDSVKRIHDASDTVESQISKLRRRDEKLDHHELLFNHYQSQLTELLSSKIKEKDHKIQESNVLYLQSKDYN